MSYELNNPSPTDAVEKSTGSTQLELTEVVVETVVSAKENTQTGKKSAATTLVEMALVTYDFGISTVGEAFALPKSGPKIVAMLRGSKTSLRGRLAREYFLATGRAASQQALADALAVIDGMAQEQNETELFLRTAKHAGAIFLDLCDKSARVVKITPNGWAVIDESPVLFKRTVLNGALPEPVAGALSDLWMLLNVAVDDRPLVAAWLVASLDSEIAHPVLCFDGEQGTAKTTSQKIIVTAIDPGPVPMRKPPRDPDSWVTAAAGSWFVGLDNLSVIQPWLSDSICRAVTGDGDVRRKLYTDGELTVFAFRRCICLNGIDVGATRGDLAERMLPIHLEIIPDSKRLAEDEIWPQWNRIHASVLGAILDLTAEVMRVLPSVELTSKPRMADFARILAAVDAVMGTNGLSHYVAKQGALALDSLTNDPFILTLLELPESFTGTSAELLSQLTPHKPPKGWPANARAVTQHIKRHAPALRKAGWAVSDDGGHNITNTLRWTLERPEFIGNSHSSDSFESGICESTSQTSHGNGQPQDDDARVELPSNAICPRCDGEGCKSCKRRSTIEHRELVQ